MHDFKAGALIGAVSGITKSLSTLAMGLGADLAGILPIVIPVGCFAWYLSARLTKLEDAVKGLECMKCPNPRSQKEPTSKS